jgi:pyrroloquinoline quinone biosynthesis protein D
MSELADTCKPRLAPKTRLKWDGTREKHLLLIPEGMLVLNRTAQEVLELCDGARTVAEIVQTLRARYSTDAIGEDVKEILQRLWQKTFVIIDD